VNESVETPLLTTGRFLERFKETRRPSSALHPRGGDAFKLRPSSAQSSRPSGTSSSSNSSVTVVEPGRGRVPASGAATEDEPRDAATVPDSETSSGRPCEVRFLRQEDAGRGKLQAKGGFEACFAGAEVFCQELLQRQGAAPSPGPVAGRATARASSTGPEAEFRRRLPSVDALNRLSELKSPASSPLLLGGTPARRAADAGRPVVRSR